MSMLIHAVSVLPMPSPTLRMTPTSSVAAASTERISPDKLKAVFKDFPRGKTNEFFTSFNTLEKTDVDGFNFVEKILLGDDGALRDGLTVSFNPDRNSFVVMAPVSEDLPFPNNIVEISDTASQGDI